MKVIHLSFLLFFCLVFMQVRAQCPPLTNNLLKGAATVCAAGNSGDIYVGDPLFSVQEWMYSTDNANWTLLPGTANTHTYTNLTQTTYFKANVLYDACAAVPSNVITVEVIPASVAGVITGMTKGCRFTHSGTLTLENYTGIIQDWLVHDTLTNAWISGGNPANQYHFTNLSTATQYKAVVKNSICPPDTSTAAVVEVYLLPEVDFNDPSDCHGTAMTFTGDVQKRFEPDNIVTSYLWNFDDGTSSAQLMQQKTYSNARVYDVQLTAVTNKNCSSSRIKPVTVYRLPVAGFTAANVCLGDSTRFIEASVAGSGAISEYSWTFGDLASSTLQHPVHRYMSAQSYTAGLQVTSVYGCSHYVAKPVQVYRNPAAGFMADSVCLGNATSFVDLSVAGEGMISRFSWRFEDAAVSLLQHPAYRYAVAGTYPVQLAVETDRGCRDTVMQDIVVHPLPAVLFDVTDACDGTAVRFTNRTTIESGSLSAYLWNFGDGSNSAEEHPEKLYYNPETYTTSLLATSEKGCESRLQQRAVVYKNPVAAFTAVNACLNYPVSLLNASFINSAESLQYIWDLGDGNYSNSRDVEHAYNFSGSFPVNLTVISGQGHCVDSMLNIVEVYAPPVIEAGEDVTVSLGEPVQLAASGGDLYSWTPAEGLSATHIATPVATPVRTTVYVVEGTDSYGCVNTDSVTVFITQDNQLFPATLITPDGNGQNDTWTIDNIENYPQALVQLFDLHGREVFSTRNYRNDWAGRNHNGDALPDGTYYYIITFNDSSNRIYKGPITVLRNR